MGLPDTCITEDKLPQCWSDEVRMNALFAPFRLKSANPESWDMKMKFWSVLLRQWCRWKKDPVVSAADLKCAFMRKGRTPACLDIVVEEMFRNGELAPLTKYQQILHNGPEGWVRWGARLAFKPAALALTAVTSLLPARQAINSDGLPKASIDSTQRFVCESAVKEQALELLENFPNDAERMGTIAELMKNCKWQQGRDTFEMLLGYLVSQGSAVKKDEVIKLAEPNKKATPVTETDEAFVRLVAAEARLEADAAKLTRDAAAAEGEARAALQLGNRLAAKNHLRRKHKLQQRIDHTDAALQNVKQLLQQMREVDFNTTIVDTYKMSSQALKRGMKEGGLDEDAVHDTMEDLKEVMETYSEVEKALAGSTDDFDAAELEQELKELLSGPAGPPGGGDRREVPVPKTPQSKKNPEPDFVFDGAERVIAELNELSVEDASPRAPSTRARVPVAEGWQPEAVKSLEHKPEPKPSQSWYPPSGECLRPDSAWNNNERSYDELRLDDRLHPGQPLNVDFTLPPKLYSSDFQVRDHKPHSGVWLYNSRDGNSNLNNSFGPSTQYTSTESPGQTGTGFQMAPGGERRRSHTQPPQSPQPPYAWPTERVADIEETLPDLELKSDVPFSSPVPDATRFSSWLRLLRATARVLQGARLFRLKLSRPIDQNSKLYIDSTTSPSQLHAADIATAEKMILQRAQRDSFPDELKAVESSQPVPKNSRIVKLAPILGQDGLLRLDSRTKYAPGVSERAISPAILDGRHHVTRLLILHEHIHGAHCFNELVLNELRQKFWILKARDSIRSVAKACLQCRRWKGQPARPQTGNLPEERLDHHKRPFTHVGLDYFGAITVTILRRHEKRYVALYTCLVTRAIHLELVTSLSSDAAIMSLRRFIARRGSPSTIFTDNGTNFVGASRELRLLQDDAVQEYATNHKIEWRFIPPASPFMGGAWERLVRTVKTALRACLAEKVLKEDVLSTLLLEAEAIINSRPLTYVPSSPDSPEAITPFHFILGSSSVAPWTSTLTDADLDRRYDWRRSLRLADQFWARWLREYLPTLRARGPSTNTFNFSEGDVVLIADPTLPRGLWPLGRIVSIYPGPDGAVRVADVRTRGGVLRRPARKLILMEAASQPVATGC